jgi:DNA-3-methyladenine glycosylase I|tara:strand:+ start:74543 stop:75136 length:594 start_codon:yes stop_codon:yes gene_type:complete
MKTEKCPWCLGFDQYINYHDKEWGVPVLDDTKQFEFLVLESAQAGLSWSTILKKRENYRQAFAGFNPKKVAQFNSEKVEELLQNAGIIRNRAKIEAAINNAKVFLDIQKEYGSFAQFIWSFVNGKQLQNQWKTLKEVPATTAISDELAKTMKKKGFKFLGSTTLYAHIQAIGMVNDHLVSCPRYAEIKKEFGNKKLI